MYRYFFLINVFVILIQAEGVIDIFYDVLGKKYGFGIWYGLALSQQILNPQPLFLIPIYFWKL